MFRAPVRMRDECPPIGRGAVDPGRRLLGRSFEVLCEFLLGFKEMFLGAVKVARDIGRAADSLTPHS